MPGEKAFRVVTETRLKEYPRRAHANPCVKFGKRETRDDPGGIGTEIVKEVLAHQSCATAFNALKGQEVGIETL